MPYLSIPAHLYRHSASDSPPPRFYEGLYEGRRQFALARQPKRCAKPPRARMRLKGASDDRRNVVFLRKIVPTTPQRSSPRTVDQVVQVAQGPAGAFGRASAHPSRWHMPGGHLMVALPQRVYSLVARRRGRGACVAGAWPCSPFPLGGCA